MSKIDLHIHSSASDGRYSAAEIVRKSAAQGLTLIAISDHDTVAGIAPALEAAKAFPSLKVIPGVEISTDNASGETHVLGYFIDHTDRELETTLKRLRNSRRDRAQGMIARLNRLGIHVDWQRVQDIAGGGAIGRPHLALAMLEKGYISSLPEAFTRYIGRGGPAYVERDKITPAEAVKLILQAGGLPVLAHPFTIDAPETIVAELKAAGLVGIEAYYDSYPAEKTDSLVSLANQYELVTTGGSDYHGLDDSNETMLGAVEVPVESVERFMALAEQRGLLAS